MKTRKTKEAKIAEINKRNLAKVNSIVFPSDVDGRYSEKDAYILIRNLNKIYDNDVQAVFDFNLNINKNEFIVLVGPSGCGKSTTLRMVCGLEEISSGELFIDGVYTNELAPKDRDIAMVFQSYALYPHMSVYDNIAFGLKIKKVPVEVKDKDGNPILAIDKKHLSDLSKRKAVLLRVIKESKDEISKFNKEIANIEEAKKSESDENVLVKYANRLCILQEKIDYENMRITKANEEISMVETEYEKAKVTPTPKTVMRHLPKAVINEKVQEAAKILEITQLLDRKPKALSGGQRQRVALGRAIVRNAKAFLMDEPLSNLDAKLRVQMRAEIVDLHKKVNATTIYVTHDQIEAMTMADRIVVMNEGVVQQIGTPRDIYEKPINLFVATFIGAPAMNIVKANVRKDKLILATGESITLSSEQVKKAKEFYEKEIARLNNINELLDHALKDETDKRHDVYLLAKDKIASILESHKKKESGEYEVLFGIRPENMTVSETKEKENISLKVDAVELLGSEYYIHTKIGEEKVVLKLASSLHIDRGDILNAKIDLDKIHIFDVFTERAMF